MMDVDASQHPANLLLIPPPAFKKQKKTDDGNDGDDDEDDDYFDDETRPKTAAGEGEVVLVVVKEKKDNKGKYQLDKPVFIRDRLVVPLAKGAKAIMEMLAEHGVVVIPDVLPADELKRTFQGIIEALQDVFPDFHYAKKETWRTLRDNMAKHGMLLQHHGLGWCQPVVDIRQVL